jgi:hypothetical protein
MPYSTAIIDSLPTLSLTQDTPIDGVLGSRDKCVGVERYILPTRSGRAIDYLLL